MNALSQSMKYSGIVLLNLVRGKIEKCCTKWLETWFNHRVGWSVFNLENARKVGFLGL